MKPKLILLSLAAIYLTVPHASFAGEQKFAHCPEVWSDYVELVRDSLASSERGTPPVLFVGTGGEVHNCLGEGIELDTLLAVQGHETSLLVGFDGEIGDEPKDWPLNVCTLAGARLEEPTYSKINLPYELPVLRGDMCTHRVAGAFNYELGYL